MLDCPGLNSRNRGPTKSLFSMFSELLKLNQILTEALQRLQDIEIKLTDLFLQERGRDRCRSCFEDPKFKNIEFNSSLFLQEPTISELTHEKDDCLRLIQKIKDKIFFSELTNQNWFNISKAYKIFNLQIMIHISNSITFHHQAH